MQGEERLGDEVTRIVVPGLERRVGVLLQENAELKGMLRHLLDSVGPLSDKVSSDICQDAQIGPWMGQSVSPLYGASHDVSHWVCNACIHCIFVS